MEKERTRTKTICEEAPPPKSSPAWESGGGSTNSPATICDESSGELFEMQRQFIFLELQRLIEQYKYASRKLHHTISYVDSHRRENLLLASEHLELLSLIEEQDKCSATSFPDITASSFSIVDDLGSKLGHTNREVERGKESVTGDQVDAEEVKQDSVCSVLPKSISIRSSGFLAVRHCPPRGGNLISTRPRHPHRLRLPATAALQDYGGEGEVEVEAYSQGTTKTELCNKWDLMGCCPYAERCQFAHGIHELRPVIRHPRYKTQICRMLDAGNGCPYGHRCHFRHSSLHDG